MTAQLCLCCLNLSYGNMSSASRAKSLGAASYIAAGPRGRAACLAFSSVTICYPMRMAFTKGWSVTAGTALFAMVACSSGTPTIPFAQPSAENLSTLPGKALTTSRAGCWPPPTG